RVISRMTFGRVGAPLSEMKGFINHWHSFRARDPALLPGRGLPVHQNADGGARGLSLFRQRAHQKTAVARGYVPIAPRLAGGEAGRHRRPQRELRSDVRRAGVRAKIQTTSPIQPSRLTHTNQTCPVPLVLLVEIIW